MGDKVSVITVVYNDVTNIRQTIDSYFSQTWENKEYIIIDGGSTDGTVDILKRYQDQFAYWCSEKDHGIYDAMNKGTKHAKGNWIIFLNSGDTFVTRYTLERCMKAAQDTNADILYGNSIEVHQQYNKRIISPSDTSLLETRPIFRHGSSLIKTSIQKQHMFDTNKSIYLGYALDWELLYKLYKSGYRFQKIDVMLEAYRKEGTSDHPYLNLWYNYKITTQGKFSIRKLWYLIVTGVSVFVKSSLLYSWLRSFLLEFMVNDILPILPSWNIRRLYLKLLGTKIGRGSYIMKNNYIINTNLLQVGAYTHINRDCILDARGGIIIEDNVSVSHRVNIMTGGHDIHSSNFQGIFKPIYIKEYTWLGVGCTILQGTTVGKGAVVCAGAVVTKDVNDYEVVAGIPAKVIGKRNKYLNYHCQWK